MSPHRTLVVLLLIGSARPLEAQTSSVPPQELHDRLVTLLQAVAPSGWVAGDTMISWYGGPKLVHVIHRELDRITEGMLRGDGMAGTAELQLHGITPASAVVRWARPDSAPVELRLSVRGDSLYLEGTREGAWAVPDGAWAIADYGMEDLAVPAASRLALASHDSTLVVYRPYAAHWDTMSVTKRQVVGDGSLLEFRNPDGKREWWLVGGDGALVQIRREGQDFERRPLEMTTRMADYRRLKPLLPH